MRIRPSVVTAEIVRSGRMIVTLCPSRRRSSADRFPERWNPRSVPRANGCGVIGAGRACTTFPPSNTSRTAIARLGIPAISHRNMIWTAEPGPMKLARNFYRPLPLVVPNLRAKSRFAFERRFDFIPPHPGAKSGPRFLEFVWQVDVVLAEMEDNTIEAEEARREGSSRSSKNRFRATGLWTRSHPANRPWTLDDVTRIVARSATSSTCSMVPESRGSLGHRLSRPVWRT